MQSAKALDSERPIRLGMEIPTIPFQRLMQECHRRGAELHIKKVPYVTVVADLIMAHLPPCPEEEPMADGVRKQPKSIRPLKRASGV